MDALLGVAQRLKRDTQHEVSREIEALVETPHVEGSFNALVDVRRNTGRWDRE